ncbi:MAG: S-methyl-5-thioribose-1-phosphate isomerase [Leptonema sp. (in: Bacteria)]|nr:S-methyl-5-thioribose-1-phosphate isomerase [Leptonema sp. (in: bacteria)]
MKFNYIPSLRYENDRLTIIDQTQLPTKQVWLTIENLETACDAIVKLKVRGAPAIGVMAALSIVAIMRPQVAKLQSITAIRSYFHSVCQKLKSTRPTAVNLFYAINRIVEFENRIATNDPTAWLQLIEKEALAIYSEDIELCELIGNHGATLISTGNTVLTHCNTGALATAGRGTALGVIYTAFFDQAKKIQVYNTETRPLLQGSRLTSFELVTAGIPTTLITDSMAATVMKQGRIDAVLVGADRIARNGDSANKVGTLSLSILANHFSIPFYVVAPSTTIDTSIADGSSIVIEERSATEVRSFAGTITAPESVSVYNPAFDVAPAELITGIVTEKGVFRPPYLFD